jgi:hypothetical protein
MLRPFGETLVAIAALLAAAPIRAQEHQVTFAIGASAVGVVTHETNTPQGRSLTEAYLTQPTVSADLRRAWLHALSTLNFEGLTLRRGELDQGAWGEGYVDRRHPHTYLHELMVGADANPGLVRLSLDAGRGFVPFGSDDPMTRPFVSYPVDHHLAQILERLVVIGGVRSGPLTLEAAIFNGDEPVSPSAAPAYNRFGDSWSVRGTLSGNQIATTLAGAELGVSYANVKSPEYRSGAGLDQRKAHASLRLAGDGGALARYALLEIAHTTDMDRGRPLYSFDALLAEGALCRGQLGIAARIERSDRPEEERLLDPFRVARPATDVSILGVTRWTTLTSAVSLPALTIRAANAHVAPFVEVARITADRTTAALFDPLRFYGSNSMWRISAGLRAAFGHDHGRMGRYGVASESLVGIDGTLSHHHAHLANSRCFS